MRSRWLGVPLIGNDLSRQSAHALPRPPDTGGQVLLGRRGTAAVDVASRTAASLPWARTWVTRAKSSTRRPAGAAGAVDAHCHLGIYRSLAEDAESETLSSLRGGVTTVISYFRTGSHTSTAPGLRAGLPRGPRNDRRSRAHRLRLSPRADDRGSGRRDPDARRRLRNQLVQVLHVLQGLDLSGVGDASQERMSENYDLGPCTRS